MPAVLRLGPYRFFFYADEGDEPPHVHVRRDRTEAKFWLNPVRFERTNGFASHELRRIQTLVEANAQQLTDAWHEYFRH